jgi:hypothetical protein
MSALTVMVALAGALTGQVRLERVDVISEDPGLWLSNEAPRLLVDPVTPAIRFVMQVKPVWSTPVRGLSFGVSIASQSLVYEYPLLESARLSLSVGLQTRLLLPRGALVGLAWRVGPVRIGAGLSVFSEASWANISYRTWTVLPTLGLGFSFGPGPEPSVP